ncbi:hypothetical protein DL769_001432 [Monosporascus sp. CRB-8-3]|nr:hypothetical protein DL769_001432 [Monosporascus sp. CRB-8-3]
MPPSAPGTTLVPAAAALYLLATAALVTCRYCARGRKIGTGTGTKNVANTEERPPDRGPHLAARVCPTPVAGARPGLASGPGSRTETGLRRLFGPGPGPRHRGPRLTKAQTGAGPQSAPRAGGPRRAHPRACCRPEVSDFALELLLGGETKRRGRE